TARPWDRTISCTPSLLSSILTWDIMTRPPSTSSVRRRSRSSDRNRNSSPTAFVPASKSSRIDGAPGREPFHEEWAGRGLRRTRFEHQTQSFARSPFPPKHQFEPGSIRIRARHPLGEQLEVRRKALHLFLARRAERRSVGIRNQVVHREVIPVG